MKFVHIADLHIGKIIYQHQLLENQVDLLNQVVDYLNDNDIDVLVIAGDVYDRAIASSESVEVLNQFLNTLIQKYHKKVLMIAGNHDSSERLNFVSQLLKSQGLYIEAFVQKELKPIIIDDVHFYLVPFFKPSYIAYLFDHEPFLSYQEAFEYYLSKQNIDVNQTNVLVTHQFIAGSQKTIQSESEVVLSVGGSEIINVDIFKDFDYVALGHLHAPQKIKYNHVRYSGSLMKYSFDEAHHQKGMLVVDLDNKHCEIEHVSLHPKKDLKVIQGTFEELLAHDYCDDYVALQVEEHRLVPHIQERLKDIFPHILQVTYPSFHIEDSQSQTKADVGFEKKQPLDIFEEFYFKMKNQTLDQESKAIIEDLFQEDISHDA